MAAGGQEGALHTGWEGCLAALVLLWTLLVGRGLVGTHMPGGVGRPCCSFGR